MTRRVLTLSALLLVPGTFDSAQGKHFDFAQAQPFDSAQGKPQSALAIRLLRLVSIPGVSGYEPMVREAIELSLPLEARVRADAMGNIVLRSGNGSPHTLIAAPLDETGLVVSAVTPDGYLRVHRHTSAPGARLSTQYLIGQPVEILTANGRIVPGVTATPSTHLRAFRDPQDEARIKGLDDIWIDVGTDSSAAVEKLGVRILDSVTLRERASALANGRVSGVGAAGRAAALALSELASRRQPGPRPPGSVSLAWVVQSEYGHRGLSRVVEALKPDRVIVLRGSMTPGDDSMGAVGVLGGGPVVAGERSALSEVATRDGISTQGVASARLMAQLPQRLPREALHVAMVPVLFAQTPVETVDVRDVDALAQLLAGAVGFGRLAPVAARSEAPPLHSAHTDSTDPTYQALSALIEAYGVSGHEAPVREQILKRLPAWAKPEVDQKGNIRVTAGPAGSKKSVVFAAHMDEVGFEIVSIADDGRAAVRGRGGMYLSLYEAQPMFVHASTGRLPAVLAPRRGYATATAAQPDLSQLTLYFGTNSAAETKALGVAIGQSVTVRKRFVPLAGGRATGRAMDDRNGSTALLLALGKIDPARLTSRVVFAWTVEEETGLAGAAHLATEERPHTAFAIDTFVSSDAPLDAPRIAGARLGAGAVLRGLDSRTLVPPHIIDRIVAIAKARQIPLQIGVTSGGTDASVFADGGAIDVGLSWPGRYSHSPVEVMDRRDLAALVDLIAALAIEY